MNVHSKFKVVPATAASKAPVRPRKRQPHLVLTAMNIAHASRGARERAFLAATWIRGGLTISEPTVALAARVFNANGGVIRDALDELAGTETTSAFGSIWAAMTPTERADFFRDHITEAWTALEMATAA